MKLYIFGYLSDAHADAVQMQIQKLKKDEKITLFIDSQGGDINSFFRLYYILKPFKNRITTVAMNYCSSGSATLFLLGKKRLILPNCTFIMHRPGFYISQDIISTRFTTLSIQEIYERFITYDDVYKSILEELKVPKSIINDIFSSELDTCLAVEDLLELGMATKIAKMSFILKE